MEQTRQSQNQIKSQGTEIREGTMTKAIEKQTAKIPSVAFLVMAGGAIALSVGIAAIKRDAKMANFVGLWVPSFLLLGIYNKLVKLEGSDQFDHGLH